MICYGRKAYSMIIQFTTNTITNTILNSSFIFFWGVQCKCATQRQQHSWTVHDTACGWEIACRLLYRRSMLSWLGYRVHVKKWYSSFQCISNLNWVWCTYWLIAIIYHCITVMVMSPPSHGYDTLMYSYWRLVVSEGSWLQYIDTCRCLLITTSHLNRKEIED